MNRIVRRLGSTPEERGSASGATCPDIFELDGGDFLVIGQRAFKARAVTAEELDAFGASVDLWSETAIVIPRQVLLDARKDVPDE